MLLLGVAGTTFGLIQARHQRTAAVDSARVAAANERRALAGERAARDQKAAAEASAADARSQKRAADAKAAEAKATLTYFTSLLAQASPTQAKDARVSKVLVDALITPALRTIDKDLVDQPLVRASVQYTLSVTLSDLGRPDLALSPAKEAWDTRRAELGANHPDTLWAMVQYGNVLKSVGRDPQSVDVLKTGVGPRAADVGSGQ